jgi:hypothetical protein
MPEQVNRRNPRRKIIMMMIMKYLWPFKWKSRFRILWKNTLCQEYFQKYRFMDSINHSLTSYLKSVLQTQHTIQINQPTRCNNFYSLSLDVYLQLNMFRASSRPSSGAQQLQTALLLPRSNGKTRGCYCGCWAPDDGREDGRNILSCKYTSSNKLEKLLHLVGSFIWIVWWCTDLQILKQHITWNNFWRYTSEFLKNYSVSQGQDIVCRISVRCAI